MLFFFGLLLFSYILFIKKLTAYNILVKFLNRIIINMFRCLLVIKRKLAFINSIFEF